MPKRKSFSSNSSKTSSKSYVRLICFVVGGIAILSIFTINLHSLLDEAGVPLPNADYLHFQQSINSFVDTAFSSSNKYRSESSVAILLQQSPVDEMKQLSRLNVIDSTWANEKDGFYGDIYAAIDESKEKELKTSNMKYQNIKTLTIQDTTPFQRLQDSLNEIINNDKHNVYDWFVIANDHTFMVKKNLYKFLLSLDSNKVSYSGNKLGISYNGHKQLFASGGSGIVLSHSSIKILLIMWSLTNYVQKNCLHECQSHQCPIKSLNKDVSQLSITLLDQKTNKCSINCLLCKLNTVIETNKLNRLSSSKSILIQLSESIDFLVSIEPHDMTVRVLYKSSVSNIITKVDKKEEADVDDPSSSENENSNNILILESWEFNNNTYDTTPALTSQKWSECSASSKWELNNPGIIVAHCLLTLFESVFEESRTSDCGERFNVYGIVRLLNNDVDEWYRYAKRMVNQEICNTFHIKDTIAERSIVGIGQWPRYRLAKDTISFHYVSSYETQLLWKLLNNHDNHYNLTTTELMAIWPSTNQNIGPYSVKLDNIQSTKVLLSYILSFRN